MVLSMAFIPLWSEGARPWVFVLTIGLLNFPEALAQTSLQNFLGTVFTGPTRATAISLRNKFGNVVVLLVTLITGLIITYAPRDDQQRMVCYQVFFVLSFLVGMLEVFVFRKFKEDKPATPPSKTNIRILGKVLKNKVFLPYLVTTIIFQFTWMAGWSLTNLYQLKVLGATEIWFTLFSVATGLGSFFTAGFWNKWIQRKGNHTALFIAAVTMSVNSLLMALSPNLIVMMLVCVFSGFSTIGVNTTILNGVLNSTPDEDRIVYIGTYNTFANLSLFISPLFSNLLLEFVSVTTTMFIVSGMRLCASLVLFVMMRRQQSATAK